ncbi:MAG: hypothetical protein ACREUW_18780 [Burkholderiales bacterium]
MRTCRRWAAVAAAGMAAGLAGCSGLGPDIIRSGRPAYNDAILQTNDEQLLQNIVRLRFGDSLGFLTVSSVTANVSVSASGSVQAGIGTASNYAGNLVPFTGTVTTEQNPTISYQPVSGDRVLRQLMNETPLDIAILLINAAHDHKEAWRAIVRRVNNLRNPDFIDPPALVADPRFDEVITLASVLQRRGSLYWVRLTGAQTGYAIVLHTYSPTSTREARRLLELLNVTQPVREGDDVVVPVLLSAGMPTSGAIAIETRSLFNLMQLAAARIDLPDGLAANSVKYPHPGPGARGIHIHVAATRPAPAQTRVAVEFRGSWYYIDQADESSKHWFTMLQLLASAQVPDTSVVGPVLTIPVTGRR